MRSAWLLILSCGLAHADLSAPGWTQDDAALTLLAPWKSCEALRERLGDDSGYKLSARRISDGAEALASSEGSGRDALGTYDTLRLRRGHCDARGWSTYGPKEWLDAQLTRLALGGAAQPTLAEISGWAEATVVRDADAPELAAARLLVQLWNRADQSPPWPRQPEHPGRPRGSPAAVWSPEALTAAGVPLSALDREDGTRADGLFTWKVRPPRRLVENARYEVWELRFRARNGGGLIAVYDRARDRHRWVWGTHGDASDWPRDTQSFRVVALDGDLLVIWNKFEQDNASMLISIDLARGTAVELPNDPRVSYRRAPGGVSVLDENGHTVKLLSLASLRR